MLGTPEVRRVALKNGCVDGDAMERATKLSIVGAELNHDENRAANAEKRAGEYRGR